MPTTSTDVQLQSAISTASMGLGPCVCAASASNTTVLPFSVFPSNTLSCFHSLWAIMLGPLPRVVRGRLGVDRHLRYFRAFDLEAVFERGDEFVHAMHAEAVGQRAVARKI